MPASKYLGIAILGCFVASMVWACSGSKTEKKQFPACDEYVAKVCELCGPKSENCAVMTTKMNRCAQTGKCVESICIDSVKSMATDDKAGLKKMLCAGSK
mgnify:CR=1 FL=1